MNFGYQIAVSLLGLAMRLATPFNKKARHWVQGRRNLLKNLERDLAKNKAPLYWMHCASVGEFEQGRPVIQALKKARPEVKVLLTFYSPSGYRSKAPRSVADYVYYLPLDSKKKARKFVDIVCPEAVLFVKYEIWPNFFQAIKNKGVPLILISAIFRDDQRFFKSRWWAKKLALVDYFFVQNDASGQLLKGIGIQEVEVAGDTRFDRVHDIASGIRELPIISKFKSDQKLLVAGSSWEQDENLIKGYFDSRECSFKLIIAPHEVEKKRVQKLKESWGDKAILYSEVTVANIEEYQVLIIDNIGMLSQIYSYADIAVIGGGFGAGIHNILEAATFGMPILFGPRFAKFNEAVELVKRKGAHEVNDQGSFNKVMDRFTQSEDERNHCGEICKAYVSEQLGATQRIVDYLMSR